GGGTLTSYTTALDDRIKAAAIGCYITTLPRRMGNRIQMDPSSDPEQDIHGFVSNGIDHAGLLALCAPRPTLICSATLDFFPVEGARESFAEARHLYQVAGASEKIAKVEAENRHSLSRPLREAVYGWFAHWLAGEPGMKPSPEIEIKPRPDSDLQVCPDGQVSVSFRSRNLLDVAVEEFQSTKKPKKMSIREILKPDLTNANPLIAERGATLKNGQPMIIFINGNEGSDWRNANGFVKKLHENGFGTVLIEPRGMGSRKRPELNRNLNYTDPVSSIEANVGYNASLVGKSLIGLRVADTLAAIDMMTREYNPSKILLCGSGDAALVGLLTAVLSQTVSGLLLDKMLLSYRKVISSEGFALSEANVVPGILRDYGDIADLLSELRARPVLLTSVADHDNFQKAANHKLENRSLLEISPELTVWLKQNFS
ncbi:MAG: hypothetical protein ACKO85_00825, partial [Isosphaeraceae bacterium]